MIDPVQGAGAFGSMMPDSVEEGGESGKSFADLVKNEIEGVNRAQIESEKLMEKFVSGEDVSPEKVMTSLRKSEMMFQFLVEIRNKLTESFDELMRIQI